ncbi:hypothetical protein LEP1GSC195_1110 [Leptospira wolbachii serovar Codice str. CDC]|uniref:Uncharacterized protein n=1 Tax=Leptospira wolbachii serovar Codice str. CDC TaxID=1218599 RepID=R9A6N0_9LEPT|nr:hypothetical protein LEP1GSC195_1110 [Leptospira wolbachii serovar Codice str. CDC]
MNRLIAHPAPCPNPVKNIFTVLIKIKNSNGIAKLLTVLYQKLQPL